MTSETNDDLTRLEAQKEATAAALDAYLAVLFPVGTRVIVNWNPGSMVGHIEHRPRDGQLAIRCENGGRMVHWRPWREILHSG